MNILIHAKSKKALKRHFGAFGISWPKKRNCAAMDKRGYCVKARWLGYAILRAVNGPVLREIGKNEYLPMRKEKTPYKANLERLRVNSFF